MRLAWSKYLSFAALVAGAAIAEDDQTNTQDLVASMGADAQRYTARACHSTDPGGGTTLYVLLEEKPRPSSGESEVHLWRLDEDGSHGYLGCDYYERDGIAHIWQTTTGPWMQAVCQCARKRMLDRFRPVRLSRTTGKGLVQIARRQKCGEMDTALYESEGRCSADDEPAAR